ncbi:hypothetical protein ABIB38_004262 [Massilia sp. UYP11]|uniref:hypothetical protein n=1 Tax=Massilia sp. UYP11 TaxID=1756385 RepID=UPI003D24F539
MSRAILYDLERKRKAAYRAERKVKSQSLEIQIQNYNDNNKYCQYKFPQADKLINDTFISNEVITRSTKPTDDSAFEEIDDKIDFCKTYVEKLLDVDLSEVRVLRVNGLNHLSEGRALSCAENEHAVLLPPKGNGFVSVDLLLHELGHTVEFMLRRPIADNDYFTNFGILSEAIAHFVQFRYLREHGTEDQKLSAIQSVIPGYIAMRVVEAVLADPRGAKIIVPEDVFDRPEVLEVRHAMGDGNFKYFLEFYRNLDVRKVYDHKVVERMGAIIALHLLDEPETVRKFCTIKALNSLEETLSSNDIDTERVLDFTKADELIKAFLN